jgi:hypothetical protein
MARKKALIPKVKAEATAKAELIAKATYQRKHTTPAVVPADVTRAKAGAWLNLISPITEWAGLKGDALRHQRHQLRIQQEAALEQLADTIRTKMKGQEILHPLPPKVLVPALEAASLEAPDSPLIEWWANLLVSGATRKPIRPFLVDLMGKIGSEEAEFLSNTWKMYSAATTSRSVLTSKNVTSYASGFVHGVLDRLREESNEGSEDVFSSLRGLASKVVRTFEGRGIGVRVVIPENATNSGRHGYGSKIMDQGVALDVCRSLNNLDYHSETVVLFEPFPAKIDLDLVYFSELGVEFMNACQPRANSDSKKAARKEH